MALVRLVSFELRNPTTDFAVAGAAYAGEREGVKGMAKTAKTAHTVALSPQRTPESPMQANNPFDKKLDLNKRLPEGIRDALVNVTDTLDFAWAAAQAVFEDQAKPEHALKICQMMMQEWHHNLRRSYEDDIDD